MSIGISRQQLAMIQTCEQFLDLRKVLAACAPRDLYGSLFSIAITDRGDGAACISG
jgi:hypothetical protein